MKIAVAGVPGAWSTEHLATSLRAEGADAFTLDLGDVLHDITHGVVEHHGDPLNSVDAVVVKKLGVQSDPLNVVRPHALRALEDGGVRVFSPTASIERALDRSWMTVLLAKAGLPIPPSLSVLGAGALPDALSRFGDAVIKPIFTSKGRGMVRVRDYDATMPMEGSGTCLVQEFVRAPGRDIGATVVAGRFVGAFYRVAAAGEWMTTSAQGGHYELCQLSAKGIEYAERAAQVFALDYTVVDLVEQGDDFCLYEVSAFGGFRGLQEASAIDAAAIYARHIKRALS